LVSLGLGVYGLATGQYMLYTGGSGQHRGWDDSQTHGRGQGWRWNESASAITGQQQESNITGEARGQGQGRR